MHRRLYIYQCEMTKGIHEWCGQRTWLLDQPSILAPFDVKIKFGLTIIAMQLVLLHLWQNFIDWCATKANFMQIFSIWAFYTSLYFVPYRLWLFKVVSSDILIIVILIKTNFRLLVLRISHFKRIDGNVFR